MAEADENPAIEHHDTSEHDITDSDDLRAYAVAHGFNPDDEMELEAARVDRESQSGFIPPVEQDVPVDDEPDHIPVPPMRLEPVYAWPVKGLFLLETSYADFGDLGRSMGGSVGLGRVLGSAEDPKLINLRNMLILYREEAACERWLLRGHWYRFFPDAEAVVAVISDTDTDPRISNLQAFQQADAARDVFYNPTQFQQQGRLQNPNTPPDYSNWP